MAKDETSTGTVIVAFALGALAGAAVALLYAPSAGGEMRKRIGQRVREGRDRADQLIRESGDALKRHGDKLEGAVESGVAAFDQARKETL